MGWLDKFVTVEKTPPTVVDEVVATVSDTQIQVQAEIASAANIVDEVFAQNNLEDKSNSIYVVQELIATLPDEMTTAKKQGTVAGILKVSGKTVGSLVEDAMLRIDTLKAACDKVLVERSAENDIANADIEELKKAIEAATIKIRENEELMEATKKAVYDEVSRIDDLIGFCSGMEAK